MTHDLDGDTLRRASDLLFDAQLPLMSAAARRVGRPGAAAASVMLLEALATGAALPAPEQLEAVTRQVALIDTVAASSFER